MRFKTDENMPIEVADVLRLHGHEAATVPEQQLAGHPDTRVAATCLAEGRVLFTLDLDFADIRTYPPEDYPGIIVLRPAVQAVGSIVRLAERAILLLTSQPLAQHLWIVDEGRVRIRGADATGTP